MKAEITRWQPRPQQATVRTGELHVWRFNLTGPAGESDRLRCLLSQDEISRADHLLVPQKKQQFIAARARLRQILGYYQRIAPCCLKFQYNNYGKPALDASHESLLSFNLSHSAHWGVLAIVNQSAVGIDIEKIEAELNFDQLAKRYFSESEQQQLATYPIKRQRRGFYRIWTKKEAVLKAEGEGFKQKLPGDEYSKTQQWNLFSCPVAAGFVCSIATREKAISMQKYHFSALTEL